MTTFSWSLGSGGPPTATAADAQTLSAIQQARASMLVRTAEGIYLTRLGQNYGVPRPELDPTNDALYRSVIQVLAWQPKPVLLTIYKLLEAIFGTQGALLSSGSRPWRVYEVNENEIIVEIPEALVTTSNSNASYMHGVSGLATADGVAAEFTAPGDLTTAATTLVGLDAFLYQSGTWTLYSITAASYDSGTDTTTLDVTPTPPSLDGVPCFIDVPGDEVSAFRGDYLATDSTEVAESSSAGSYVTSYLDTDYASGVSAVDLKNSAGDIWPTSGTVTFEPGTPREESFGYTRAVDTLTLTGGPTAYSHDEYTPVVTQGAAPAIPAEDRPYLTGLGLLETFDYYMGYCVKAAGIVLRYEYVGGAA